MTKLISETDQRFSNLSAFGAARSTIHGAPLAPDELRQMDAYFRANLYLCLGMIYLRNNPLLRRPLYADDTIIRLLGHWGSDPGMSFIYLHLNRLIKKYDLNMIFLAGPGHGAPAILSHAYLEGTIPKSKIGSDNAKPPRSQRPLFSGQR
jgi:xylulose-5-phosphate/fructose-6-phosphate phosphoketolase